MTAKTFKEKVFDIVRKIPAGRVLTYGEVARRVGNPKATRAVGGALRTNYDPEIPCHRVIASNGALTGYNRGLERKEALLQKEGAMPMIESIRKNHRRNSK